MTLLLCPHCFTWGEPRSGSCPTCCGAVDADAPDPDAETLARTIGPVTHCLGEVFTPRRLLPERGLLYATGSAGGGGGGLFFLPHRPEVRLERPDDDGGFGGALVGTVAAAVWTPLMVLGPLWRLTRTRPRRRVVFEPVDVPADGAAADGAADGVRPVAPVRSADLLAEHLVANPGAFFVPRRSVRFVRRRGRRWTVECLHRPALRFRALSDPRGVRANLEALDRTPRWCGVLA